MAAATPAAQTAQSADQHSQHAPQDAKQAGHDLPDEVSAEISVLQTSQPEATAQVPAVSEDVQQQPTSLRNGGSDCSEPMQLTPAVPDDLPLDQAKESASSADPLADTNRGNSEADQAVEVAASPVHARHPIEHLEAINMAQSAEGSHCHSAQESIYSSVPSAPDACDKHDAVKVVDVTNAPAAAAVAGILPAKHKSPDKPEHISNSSTVSGQGQGLQTTRLEAPAEAVMEGSASRTGQDAAVQDMHTEEQQHLPLNIVPAAAQSTMPPVQADTYQKPATFSWHKVGKTWKPRKLPGSKRRRASLL